MAGLLVLVEEDAETVPSAGEPHADGARLGVQFLGNSGDREVGEVVQDDGVPLVGGSSRRARCRLIHSAASGWGWRPNSRRLDHARTKASWTASAAASGSPHMAVTCPTSTGYRAVKYRSNASASMPPFPSDSPPPNVRGARKATRGVPLARDPRQRPARRASTLRRALVNSTWSGDAIVKAVRQAP